MPPGTGTQFDAINVPSHQCSDSSRNTSHISETSKEGMTNGIKPYISLYKSVWKRLKRLFLLGKKWFRSAIYLVLVLFYNMMCHYPPFMGHALHAIIIWWFIKNDRVVAIQAAIQESVFFIRAAKDYKISQEGLIG